MRPLIGIAACSVLLGGLLYGRNGKAAEPRSTTAPAGLVVQGTRRSIKLPEIEPELPRGEGRDTTQLFCASCHTTQYITIQPAFSRETWLAEVTKMRKAFIAPIPEEKIPEIVDYLYLIRGTEPK